MTMSKLHLFLLSFVILVGCDQTTSTQNQQPYQSPSTKYHPSSNNKGAWITKTYTNNKETIYSASLTASNINTSFNNPVTLTIQCMRGNTELMINWGQHVPRGSKMSIYLKFGEQAILNSEWRYLKDTALAYAHPPHDILELLTNNNKLIMRTSFFQGSIATATFNLQGVTQVVQDIKKACTI